MPFPILADNGVAQTALYTDIGNGQAEGIGTSNPLSVSPPIAATPLAASATGAAAAAVSVSLPAIANKTTFISQVLITTGVATVAAVTGAVTITGLSAGTLTMQLVEATSAGSVLHVRFQVALPASAQNTAISVNVPAITSGGVVSIVAVGFAQ